MLQELLENIFCLLLAVEAFSLKTVVEMLEEVVVNWWEVRWRKWQPTPEFLPGEYHGWRSLVGYSPRVAKSRTRRSDFTFTFTDEYGRWVIKPSTRELFNIADTMDSYCSSLETLGNYVHSYSHQKVILRLSFSEETISQFAQLLKHWLRGMWLDIVMEKNWALSWPRLVAGIAVFGASHQFVERTSQM